MPAAAPTAPAVATAPTLAGPPSRAPEPAPAAFVANFDDAFNNAFAPSKAKVASPPTAVLAAKVQPPPQQTAAVGGTCSLENSGVSEGARETRPVIF